MKSINVKKLAALAVGALFVGQAAYAAMATSTLPTDKSWYLHSAIVIGAKAKPADVVWAGNIAAAIGQMAFTEEQKTASVDLSNAKVKLKSAEAVVLPSKGKTETLDNTNLNPSVSTGEIDSTNPVTVTNAYVPDLKESAETTFKFGPADSLQDGTAYVSEKLHLDYANVVEYVNDNEASLKTYTNSDKFYYEITLTGLGLDVNKDYKADATGSNPAIKNLYIPILGKEYKVTEIDTTTGSQKLTIEGYSNEVDLAIGDTTAIPGTDYSVKLLDIDADNGKAYLQLLDSQGNVVASDVVAEGGETDFDGTLSSPVKVEAVFSGTQNKFAKVALSSEKITLGVGDTKDDWPAKGWQLKLESLTNNEITLYVQYDDDGDQTYLTPERGLGVGDTMKIPGTNYGVMFGGFEAKPMQTISFDGSAKTVTAMDARGITETFKLYDVKTLSFSNASGDEQDAIVTISNIIGDRDLKLKVEKDTSITNSPEEFVKILYDKDAQWSEGEDWTSSDIGTVYLYYTPDGSDANKTVDAKFTAIKLDLDNDGTPDAMFVIAPDNEKDPTKLYIYYGGFEVKDNGSDLNIYTDTDNTPDGTASITPTTDVKYEIGAEVNSTGPEFKGWYVTDGGSNTIFVPAYTVYDDQGSGSKLELQTPINLDKEQVDVAGVFKVDTDSDTSDYPTKSWTNFGSEVDAVSSSKVNIEVPTEQREMQIFVGELPQTVEQAGYTEVAVGDTIPGTPYTIEGIEAEGASTTCTAATPMKDWNPVIVYLDTTLPNTYDNIIVVGGYAVNTVAAQLAQKFPELKDVNKAGDWIVKKVTDNGKDYIVVFGYTAEDTGTAAQEFINWLRQNVAFPQTE